MAEQTGILTNAGKAHIAAQALANQGLDIVKVILANVPNLSESTDRNSAMALPTAHVVFETENLIDGFVDDNTVAWACVLDQDVGDFDYNFIGLVTGNNTLLAIDYLPLQRKRKGVNNVHNRSFVLKFAAAKSLAKIEIPAASWMFDYSIQLSAIQLTLMANATAQITNMYRSLRNMFALTDLKNISKEFK